MKSSYICCVLLFVLFLVSCTDGRSEGQVARLLRQAETCMEEYPDSALVYLHQIPDPEKLTGENQADYCLLLTQAMDKNDLPLSSDSLIQIAVGYYSNGKDRLKKGKASFYLGRVKSSRGMLEDVQKYFLEALSVLNVTDNLKYQALVRNHLGQLYMNLDLYQDALIMNSQSVSLFQQLTDTANLVYAERDMGRIYLLKGQQDSASFYYQQAINDAFNYSKSDVYKDIVSEWGQVVMYLEMSPSAEQMLLSNLESDLVLDKTPVCLSLGIYYLSNKLYSKAEGYLLKAATSSRPYTRVSAYKYLGHLETRNLDLIYWDQYEQALDSLGRQNLAYAVKEIQEKYNNAALQAHTFKLENERLHSAISYLSIILLLLSITASIYIFYIKERRKRQLEREKFNRCMRKYKRDREGLLKKLDDSKLHIAVLEASKEKQEQSSSEERERTNILLKQEEENSCKIKEQLEELEKKWKGQLAVNKRLRAENKDLSDKIKSLKESDIKNVPGLYQSINLLVRILTCDPLEIESLKVDDWEGLFRCIDLLYGNSLRKFIDQYQKQHDGELDREVVAICYFEYIKVKHARQAAILRVSTQALSKRKQRLKIELGIPDMASVGRTIKKVCPSNKK